MGMKPRKNLTRRRRQRRKQLVCRNCEAKRSAPGKGSRCAVCGVRVCDHLADNLIKTREFDGDDMCIWCSSIVVFDEELEA